MILEFGHIYFDDIKNNNINEKDIVKSIELAKEVIDIFPIEQKVVLIDDKKYDLSNEEKISLENFIKEYYTYLGLAPDKVYFEKHFLIYENILYEKFKSDIVVREPFKRDKKLVEFLLSDSNKIPLKQIYIDKEFHSCQLLSSLWLLYKYKILSSKGMINILNEKYRKVEEQVSLILKESDIEIPNNQYIWYQ